MEMQEIKQDYPKAYKSLVRFMDLRCSIKWIDDIGYLLRSDDLYGFFTKNGYDISVFMQASNRLGRPKKSRFWWGYILNSKGRIVRDCEAHEFFKRKDFEFYIFKRAFSLVESDLVKKHLGKIKMKQQLNK